MPNHIIIIFVKYPEPGKVKTRLGRDIGNDKAVELYSALAQSVIHNVSKSGNYKTIIFFDPPERKTDVENWLSNCGNLDNYQRKRKSENNFSLFAQEGKSLGEKMANAFSKVFSFGAENVIIIGTDCIEISEEIISQAFDSLQTTDVVLGPAEDGGYYLLGLTKPIPEIFDDIDWSTEFVLGQTLNRIKERGFQFKLLKTLRDVDTVNDLSDELLLMLEA